jgi:hypothetical protein
VAYGEEEPNVMEVLTIMIQTNAPQWMGKRYGDKLTQDEAFENLTRGNSDVSADEFEQLMTAYEKFVPVDSLDQDDWAALHHVAGNARLNPAQQERLKSYLEARTDH